MNQAAAANADPLHFVGPRLRSAFNVLAVVGAIWDGAEKEFQARLAGVKQVERTTPKGPIEEVLEQVGINLPALEMVLGKIMGDTPEARKMAAEILKSRDAAALFQEFAMRFAAANGPASSPGGSARPAPPSAAEARVTEAKTPEAPTPEAPPPASPPTAPPPGPVGASQGAYPQASNAPPPPAPGPVFVSPHVVYGFSPEGAHATYEAHPQAAAMDPNAGVYAAPWGAAPPNHAGYRLGHDDVLRLLLTHEGPVVRRPPPPPPSLGVSSSPSAWRPGWSSSDLLPKRRRTGATSASRTGAAASPRSTPASPAASRPQTFKAPSAPEARDKAADDLVTRIEEELRSFITWSKEKFAAIEDRMDTQEQLLLEILTRLDHAEAALRVIEAEAAGRSGRATATATDVVVPAEGSSSGSTVATDPDSPEPPHVDPVDASPVTSRGPSTAELPKTDVKTDDPRAEGVTPLEVESEPTKANTSATRTPSTKDDQVIDAEIVDTEVVDAEGVDTEVARADQVHVEATPHARIAEARACTEAHVDRTEAKSRVMASTTALVLERMSNIEARLAAVGK
ncbi:MAG: hypothetical protein R3B09_15985 [Nannocystaceae bacterium]